MILFSAGRAGSVDVKGTTGPAFHPTPEGEGWATVHINSGLAHPCPSSILLSSLSRLISTHSFSL